ncbi:MAG: HEAT repeat domain-containing protein [Tepidisphaeraceae bacterium]
MRRLWPLLALVFFFMGCGPHRPSQRGMEMPPPPRMPDAPRLHPQSLDPALRDAARGELMAESDAASPIVRSHAIEAMSEAAGDLAAHAILKALSDPEPVVRFAAAMAAGRMRLKVAYQPMLAMVQDKDARVRAGVRFALHRLGDTRFSHDLERLAVNSDSSVRGATAMALGLLGEPSATRVLLPMMSDSSSAVRIQAAEALWRLGNETGLKDLVEYSISPYPDDQMIAIVALAEPRDQRVIYYVRGALDNDYPEVSLAAARAMGMLDSDEGWYVAVPRTRSSDARQRYLAALALGAIGRSDLQGILAPLLKDPEPSVRIAAATAVLQLHGP